MTGSTEPRRPGVGGELAGRFAGGIAVGGLGGERVALLAIWGVGVLGCVLCLAFPAQGFVHPTVGEQLVDLLRVVAAATLAVVLMLGPGILVRACYRRRRIGLGFLALPGIAALAFAGVVAWVLAGTISPKVVCAIVLAPVLAAMPAGLLLSEPGEILSEAERRALIIAGGALGVGIARAVWSLSPPGEWGEGTVFRSLEVGDRSDSRLSYGIVQLVAHGTSPWSALAQSYFQGYTFSARGALPGLTAAPIALLTGARPPIANSGGPWSPFDPQGFMAYRETMMVLASTSLLSLWTLVRRLAGTRAAQFAVLLAATTPFVVHEVWFTWPKLAAASFVLLAAFAVLERRPLAAGILVGIGYLCHPLALLWLPPLILLALWPLLDGGVGSVPVRPSWGRLRSAVALGGGAGAVFLVWRLVNVKQYTQGGFLQYVTQAGTIRADRAAVIVAAGGHAPPITVGVWLSDRLVSLANTLVPLRLFLLGTHDPGVNAPSPKCYPFCFTGSGTTVHFFFQYWTGVPFGLAIVFFPLLLISLWHAWRRWPWGVTATVLVPLLVFTVYWGGAVTGMLREGMHPWVLTLLAVVAVEQASNGFRWLRSRAIRTLLALRAVEVLFVAMVPTLVTRRHVASATFRVSDVVAAATMVVLCAWLGRQVWLERPSPDEADRPAVRPAPIAEAVRSPAAANT